MVSRWKIPLLRWVSALPVLLALGCTLQRDSDGTEVLESLRMFPGRYDGLEGDGITDAKEKERQFAVLMKGLSRYNRHDLPHDPAHEPDDTLEHRLWALLRDMPNYPGSGRVILAAIDQIYLGYRENGNWGWWWHCPYFNCFKATLLAERLSVWHRDLAQEALWTRIYCYRVNGLGKPVYNFGEYPWDVDYESMQLQHFWRSDPAKVKALCEELLQRFPNGKYAGRAKVIHELKDVTLTIPGREGVVDMQSAYPNGPPFVIDRKAE